MTSKLVSTIIVITGIGPILLTLFITSQGFSIIPQFEVKMDDTDKMNTIIINNIGLWQIKNSKVIIPNFDSQKIELESCLEGNLLKNGNYSEIVFERMSRNLICSLSVVENIDYGFDLTITGDNISAYYWSYSPVKGIEGLFFIIFLIIIAWLLVIVFAILAAFPAYIIENLWKKRKVYKKRYKIIDEEIKKNRNPIRDTQKTN